MSQILRADLPRTEKGNDPNDNRGDPAYLNSIEFERLPVTPPPKASLFITDDELLLAELTPKCIVQGHLYADVAERVAPGGTGKTTLTLWESVHIVLGLPLYGCPVVSSGWLLIVTAEDRRERLVARLGKIMDGMDLTPRQRQKVQQGLLIWDVTGQPAKLVQESDGNLALTTLADDIIEMYRDDPPVFVEFDPLVSFGASEQRVNDNEQALVLAARRIVNGLDCCVRYTHHTGKQNARDKTADQYSGRGGSALPDGCRMVGVLQTWSPSDSGGLRPPSDLSLAPHTQVIVYTRAKLSYAPSNLPRIWIKRDGYRFEWLAEQRISDSDAKTERVERLLAFLADELTARRYHTKTSLRAALSKLGMTQVQINEAVQQALAAGDLHDMPLPKDRRQGGRQSYLQPKEVATLGSNECKRVGQDREAE